MSNVEGSKAITKALYSLLGPNVAIGFQQLTVSSSAVQLTVPDDANRCLIVVESTIAAPGYAIRLREDGTAPTASIGLILTDTQVWEIVGNQNMGQAIFIQAQVGTHKLNVQYYR